MQEPVCGHPAQVTGCVWRRTPWSSCQTQTSLLQLFKHWPLPPSPLPPLQAACCHGARSCRSLGRDPGHLFGLCTVDPIKTDHSRHHTHNLLCCILFLFHSLQTVSHIVSRARLWLFLIDTTSYDLCTLMLQSLPIHLVDFKFIWNNILYPENCWSYYYCICMSHIKQSYLKWNCSTSNECAAAAGSSLSPHCPCARVWCRVCIVQPSVPCSVRYRWHVVIEFRHMIDQTFCCSLLKLLSSYI